MQQATAVPYANIEQCGRWRNIRCTMRSAWRADPARRADWLDAASAVPQRWEVRVQRPIAYDVIRPRRCSTRRVIS